MTPAATDSARGYDRDALQERLRPSWRRRLRRSRLLPALLLSGTLHLSMVTLFTVVIYFPRQDTRYYAVAIVQESPRTTAAAPSQELGLHLDLDQELALSGRGEAAEAELPEISLPTLEFAQLERMRALQDSAGESSLYDELFNDEPEDSWARFGRGMQELGQSLARLTPFGETLRPTAPLAADQPSQLHRPARGFQAYIVWASGARERELILSPPIPALQKLSAEQRRRPIELVLQVDAEGQVVNATSPELRADEVLDEVQRTVLRQYRFAPITETRAAALRYSLGTLYIESVESGP